MWTLAQFTWQWNTLDRSLISPERRLDLPMDLPHCHAVSQHDDAWWHQEGCIEQPARVWEGIRFRHHASAHDRTEQFVAWCHNMLHVSTCFLRCSLLTHPFFSFRGHHVQAKNHLPEFQKGHMDILLSEVWNTYGSSAGSGSCSIPIYYKHRRIELASRRFLE